MKKHIIAISALAVALCASAQNEDYNRVGISFDHTGYSFNNEMKVLVGYDGDKHLMKGIGANGFGINYIHGFSLTESVPLYLEAGANINFMFGSKKAYESQYYKSTVKGSDINMQIPVNLAWKFNVNEDFAVTPYVGINFKLHFATKFKVEELDKEDGTTWKSPSYSVYSSEDWAKYDDGWEPGDEPVSQEDKDACDDLKWNRFQMGWQIGVGFQYKPVYLGVQWGTDFIPAYSHNFKDEIGVDYKCKVNTNTLKVTLGYCF